MICEGAELTCCSPRLLPCRRCCRLPRRPLHAVPAAAAAASSKANGSPPVSPPLSLSLSAHPARNLGDEQRARPDQQCAERRAAGQPHVAHREEEHCGRVCVLCGCGGGSVLCGAGVRCGMVEWLRWTPPLPPPPASSCWRTLAPPTAAVAGSRSPPYASAISTTTSGRMMTAGGAMGGGCACVQERDKGVRLRCATHRCAAQQGGVSQRAGKQNTAAARQAAAACAQAAALQRALLQRRRRCWRAPCGGGITASSNRLHALPPPKSASSDSKESNVRCHGRALPLLVPPLPSGSAAAAAPSCCCCCCC